MPPLIQSEQQIGRRLRLRDLSVFCTVVEQGSMAKAGVKLGVSTPSISEVIAGLEHALGVRLLDRSPKGVIATQYGNALLVRARAAFDELRQGIKDIEAIGDPHAGELTIGCPESITAGFLLPVLQRLTSAYPRIQYDVRQVLQPTVEYPELHDRKVDLVLARWGQQVVENVDAELEVEVLFNDPFFLVVGEKSEWGRCPTIRLPDLVGVPMIMPAVDTWGGALVVEAFRRAGLKEPKFTVSTLSIPLRVELVASGHFVSLLSASVIQTYGERYSLKVLPIQLPAHQSPVGIVTLRNRTLSPVVQLFVQCAREISKMMPDRLEEIFPA